LLGLDNPHEKLVTVRRVLSDWERTTEESELVVRKDCWSRDQCVDDHQRAGAALMRPKRARLAQQRLRRSK